MRCQHHLVEHGPARIVHQPSRPVPGEDCRIKAALQQVHVQEPSESQVMLEFLTGGPFAVHHRRPRTRRQAACRVPCHVTKWVMVPVCRNRYGTDWPRTYLSEPRQAGRLEWIRPETITSAGWQTSDSLGTKQVLFGLPVRPFQCVIEPRA